MRTEKIWRAALIGAILFAGGAMWHAGSSSAEANNRVLAEPTVVRTININNVLESLEQRTVEEDQLKAYFGELEAQVNALRDDLKAAQDDLSILVPGTPQFSDKRNQVVRLRLKVEGESQLAVALAEERKKNLHADLFEKIKDATRRFSEQEGIAIVLNDDSGTMLPVAELSDPQLQAAIIARRIIFASPMTDISADVALMMNNEFRAGR